MIGQNENALFVTGATAQWIHFGRQDWRWVTENMPRICLSLVSVFQRVLLSSYWPQTLTEATEMGFQNLFFWRSTPINGKISKFLYETMHADTESRIPAISWKSVAMCGIPCRKNVSILPLSVATLVRPRQKFYRVTLSPLPSLY